MSAPVFVSTTHPFSVRTSFSHKRATSLFATHCLPSCCAHHPPRQQFRVSRKALISLFAVAVVSAATSDREAAHMLQFHPPSSLGAYLASSNYSPLLDNDYAPEGIRNPSQFYKDFELSVDPFQAGRSVTRPMELPVTYEDYLNALHLPPIDIVQELRDSARTALLAAIPVTSILSLIAYSSRTNPRVTLPVVYDVDALQRYFSVRPDVVLSRLLQFFREGTLFASGILSDKIAASFDALLVRWRVRPAKWSQKRIRRRSQQRAVALRGAITRLGPAMIKLGQAVASRPDLLPPPVVRELQPLQDDVVAVFPSQQAFDVIRDELGASVKVIFDEIDADPVAGASLGMVFKAKIDGTPVAVKVQRPEVAASVALDCYIVRTLAKLASTLFDLRTDWRAAVDEYASRLFEELDYTKELINMGKFRELYGNVSGVYLPRAFPTYCSRRVLVTEWVDGEKLIDEDARVRQEDLKLVETGIRFALIQLLDKGFLHADMHNGNSKLISKYNLDKKSGCNPQFVTR